MHALILAAALLRPFADPCDIPQTASISFTGTGCTFAQCPEDRSVKFTLSKNGKTLQSCDSVAWDFGNGSTSSLKSPSRTFATPGVYVVQATITTPGPEIIAPPSYTSLTVSKTLTIVPGCPGPVPSAANLAMTYQGSSTGCRQSNSTACARGETIAFSLSTFGFTLQGCEAITWDFGDGSTWTGVNPTHVFGGSAAQATVKVRVQNDSGAGEVTQSIPLSGDPVQPAPALTFTMFPSSGERGRPVTFTAASNLSTTNGWTWSFGDGTASDTSQAGAVQQSSTISHTFASPGTYLVQVRARNALDPAQPLSFVQKTITIMEAPETSFLIPVIAHVGDDAAPVRWRTDMQIFNPDPAVSAQQPLILSVQFAGQQYAMAITRSTAIVEDLLWNLVGPGNCPAHVCAGPAIITTSAAHLPYIWTRTYVNTGNGTYGQFIPAVRLDDDDEAGSGGSYYLTGLKVDSRFRANIGLVNPTTAPVDATVLFLSNRNLVRTTTKRLQPFVFNQFGITRSAGDTATTIGVPGLPPDAPFTVQVVVPQGGVFGYASLVDNTTNDPIFISAVHESELASADYRTVIVPGVAHVGQWRSDLTMFNPENANVSMDVEYFDTAGNRYPRSGPARIPVGQLLQVDDVLKQGALGLVPDGAGFLKLTVVEPSPAVYPFSFARTYFDTIFNGTYGQGIPAFPASRANVKTGQPAVIPAIRGGVDYRTNVFLVNLGAAATRVRVSALHPDSGVAVAALEYDLVPGQTIVHANFMVAMGLQFTQTSLKVEIAPGSDGTVWAYASVVDQRTSDPEYLPAFPFVP